MDQTSDEQLRIIDEITESLSLKSVPHWLFGGWAVDFATHEITRTHDDVDFVVWESDVPAVEETFSSLGYESRPSRHPEHQQNWVKSGTKIQINLVRRLSDGTVVSPGTFEDWPWTEDAFADHRGALREIDVPIVSPHGQLESKRGFPLHPSGRRHRKKDIHDIALLERLVKLA